MNLFARPQHASLPVGRSFRLRQAGLAGTVGVCLGAGGQGAAYACDVGGRRMAFKWYWPEIAADPGLAERIDRLTARESPDRRFLWPVDRVDIEGLDSFGYLMPLVSSDRVPLARLFASEAERITMPFAARAFCCFDIAEGFLALHAQGLSYQDINLGSFFVDPLRGDILICDLDNVAPDGEPGGVYGTRRFEPPEVVLRAALPSARTDLFAMAVLFFMILFDAHPLEGMSAARLSAAGGDADRQIYGAAPLFVFDPDDSANRPTLQTESRLRARWTGLPPIIRDLFLRAFTVGLSDPGARVLESEWRVALAGLRDAVVTCPACGYEQPLTPAMPDDPPECPSCSASVPRPSRLTLPHALVGLGPASSLYKHHLDREAPPSFAQAVATVTPHPTDLSVTGLHNLSEQTWTAQSETGAFPVAAGQTVRISDKLTIMFGSTLGRVAEADQ